MVFPSALRAGAATASVEFSLEEWTRSLVPGGSHLLATAFTRSRKSAAAGELVWSSRPLLPLPVWLMLLSWSTLSPPPLQLLLLMLKMVVVVVVVVELALLLLCECAEGGGAQLLLWLFVQVLMLLFSAAITGCRSLVALSTTRIKKGEN